MSGKSKFKIDKTNKKDQTVNHANIDEKPSKIKKGRYNKITLQVTPSQKKRYEELAKEDERTLAAFIMAILRKNDCI